MYFITTKRMLEVCFSAHPNIQYRTSFLNIQNARLPPLLVLRMKMAIKCAGRDQVKDFDNLSLPPPLDSRKDRAMTPDCMIKTDWTKFRCSSYNEARYWFVFRRSTLCA